MENIPDRIKSMSDKELDRVIKSNEEWRRMLWQKMDILEHNIKSSDSDLSRQLSEFKLEYMKKITTLEVKVASYGAIFGFVSGSVVSIIAAFIKLK